MAWRPVARQWPLADDEMQWDAADAVPLGRSTTVRYGMDDGTLREICGAITEIAGKLGCGFIDINCVTAGHPEAFRFDGVHPGAAGARLIARAVFETVSAARNQD